MDFDAARAVVDRRLDSLYAGGHESPRTLPYGYDAGTSWAPLVDWDGVMGVYVYLVDKRSGRLTPLSFDEFLDVPQPRRVGTWPRASMAAR